MSIILAASSLQVPVYAANADETVTGTETGSAGAEAADPLADEDIDEENRSDAAGQRGRASPHDYRFRTGNRQEHAFVQRGALRPLDQGLGAFRRDHPPSAAVRNDFRPARQGPVFADLLPHRGGRGVFQPGGFVPAQRHLQGCDPHEPHEDHAGHRRSGAADEIHADVEPGNGPAGNFADADVPGGFHAGREPELGGRAAERAAFGGTPDERFRRGAERDPGPFAAG